MEMYGFVHEKKLILRQQPLQICSVIEIYMQQIDKVSKNKHLMCI